MRCQQPDRRSLQAHSTVQQIARKGFTQLVDAYLVVCVLFSGEREEPPSELTKAQFVMNPLQMSIRTPAGTSIDVDAATTSHLASR